MTRSSLLSPSGLNLFFCVHHLVMTTVSEPIRIPKTSELEIAPESEFNPSDPSPPNSWNSRLHQRAARWQEERMQADCQISNVHDTGYHKPYQVNSIS